MISQVAAISVISVVSVVSVISVISNQSLLAYVSAQRCLSGDREIARLNQLEHAREYDVHNSSGFSTEN